MSPNSKELYEFADFRLDIGERMLVRNGTRIPLPEKAFEVLCALVKHDGHLITKDQLLGEVWPDTIVEENNLDKNVSLLRHALGEERGKQKFIETVRGHGYRFVANVRKSLLTEPVGAVSGEIRILKPANKDKIGKHLPLPEKGKSRSRILTTDSGTIYLRVDPPARTFFDRKAWFVVLAIGVIAIGVAAMKFWPFTGVLGSGLTFELARQAKLTQSGNVYAPVISPDGKYLVYVDLSGNAQGLSVRQITTGSVLQIVQPRPGVKYWALVPAPDNSFLYYISKDQSNEHGILYRVPLFGGEAQKLAEYANGGLTVSPDGQNIAFIRISRETGNSSIVSMSAGGGNESIVHTANPDSMFYSLDWAPDGKSFGYAFKNRQVDRDYWYVAEIPAEGGRERRIGEISESKINGAKWVPDKCGLIVNAVNQSTRLPQIYFLSYPDGTMRSITNDLNNYAGLSLPADGRSLVASQTKANRQIWEGANGLTSKETQLTNGTEKHYNSVAWSPDGFLVFDEDENSSFDNYNIWRMRPDGTELRQITFGTGNNSQPTVSSDGKFIAFVSRKSGNEQIWKMNPDGTNQERLTNISHRVSEPRFSSDGKRILFAASANGKGAIWQIPLEGGEAEPVIEADVHFWDISPDGYHIAYSTFDSAEKKVVTRVHRLDGESPDRVLTIAPETWLMWSGDGRSLFYNTAEDEVRNIWSIDLEEGRRRKVTDFKNERVFRWAWSPDGKRFACIRQSITYDAVMIWFG